MGPRRSNETVTATQTFRVKAQSIYNGKVMVSLQASAGSRNESWSDSYGLVNMVVTREAAAKLVPGIVCTVTLETEGEKDEKDGPDTPAVLRSI